MITKYWPSIFLVSVFILLTFSPVLIHAAATSLSNIPKKEVFLTFDDGPYGTSTEKILTILKNEGVHATFFLNGKNVEKYPALTREIVANGNEIGNHTYDHTKYLTTMATSSVKIELSKTESVIASTTGVHALLFRPPYGKITQNLRREIESLGYKVVMWNVDPRDWDNVHSSSSTIAYTILHSTENPMIVLLHDGRDTKINYSRENTIEALPSIIRKLKMRNFSFGLMK